MGFHLSVSRIKVEVYTDPYYTNKSPSFFSRQFTVVFSTRCVTPQAAFVIICIVSTHHAHEPHLKNQTSFCFATCCSIYFKEEILKIGASNKDIKVEVVETGLHFLTFGR